MQKMNCVDWSIDRMEIQQLSIVELSKSNAEQFFCHDIKLAFKYYLLSQLSLLQLSAKQHFDFEDIFRWKNT